MFVQTEHTTVAGSDRDVLQQVLAPDKDDLGEGTRKAATFGHVSTFPGVASRLLK